MSVDVSVIVPVYNAESFLPKCIETLIKQTKENIELIFVDDGSTDRSLTVLETYQQKDHRIKVLQQQNQFAGVARNNGLKYASGKYVIFLDADDFFEPTMLEEAFQSAEENRAQIVIFTYYRYDHLTGTDEEQSFAFPAGVFSAEDLGDAFFDSYIAAPWNKLFLKEFILENGFEFQPVRKCNDMLFTFLAGATAERMFYLPSRLLHYRTNNGNSLQGKSDDARSYIDCGISALREFKNRNLLTDHMRNALLSYNRKLVYMGDTREMSFSEAQEYFDYVKAHLIPDLFESPLDFSEDTLVRGIYDSDIFSEYLFAQNHSLSKQMETMVSKSERDYRLGHTLLKPLRKIKQLLA